jgi:hypothetical protein
MKTPHVFSASAAAVLAMAMAAFAQAPQTSRPASDAQASRQPASPVTLVGCIQREAEYRKANDSGRGGVAGTGLGRGNEYVLVNASRVSAGSSSSASADCAAAGQGEAYELTGSRERELEKFVGRRVEISGMLKEAETEPTGPGGAAKPTGGFDPLRQDLKLFEVEVQSFREPSAGQSSQAAPPPAASTPPPAPTPRQAAPPPPEPAAPAASAPSAAPSPRQQLPRTASPVPLVGLIGLLSFGLGMGLRRRR